ncbi:hypothetical protein WJX77_003113 [Trebouxia sp. C0004]
MAKLVNMRGLQVFISDIRNCSNKEQEQLRVDKELGKIRKKFASGNVLSEYDKKKYVWKLLYIYMLGYDVEFGHKQAADLIPVNKYAEKQVGYMACSVLLTEKDEFLRLIINSIRNDLISRNEAFQCLALGFIGNVGGQEMASLLAVDVMALVTNGAVRPIIRKKAALCLLRLLRKAGPDSDMLAPDVWSVKLGNLLEEQDLGVLMAVVTLLLGIVSRNYEGYESLTGKLVKLLERLKNREVSPDYTYYGIASPWLQVKCLRVLQYFPVPDDPVVSKGLEDVLKRIITGNEVAKNINKNNAQHAIVFEAVALALAMEANTELLQASVSLLGKFISVREPNIKYLGLENMVRLAEVPAVIDTIHRHQKSIVATLKDADISIRQRGLDLLFTMCNNQNVRDIVDELLKYLEIADFTMRDELVLKTAVLAERFFPDLEWYTDVMITLIERAGEFSTKDIWHSTVQLITNNDDLHMYAATKVIEALQRGAAHESLVCCAAYLLGEYGRQVQSVPLREQFGLLQERFPTVSSEAKGLLLSAYLKMLLADPNDAQLRQQISAVYERYSHFMDADLQQRAVEYQGLMKQPDVASRNVTAMPKWEKRKSLLLRRMAEKEGEEEETQQKPVWLQEDGQEVGSPTAANAGQLHLEGPTPTQPMDPQGAADFIGLDDDTPVSNGNTGAAAPSPTPPAARNPLEELYGTPEPAQPSAADPFATSGGGAPQGPPSSPASAGSAEPVRPIGDINDWFRKLCQSPSGVLYEDNYLQVGVKTQYQGSQGQIMFFLGNKHAAPLERIIFVVPPQPQFQFQLAPVPQRLEAKQQLQVALRVTCVSSFPDVPHLQLSYSIQGQQVAHNLMLPIVVSKFCTPPDNPVPKDVFFSRWRAIAGPPQKVGERVTRVTPVAKGPVEALLSSLNLGPQQGLDPEPDNIVAVGTFTSTPPGQPPQQVACMVRIEVEKAQRLMFQVTVGSSDVNTSAALKDLIAQLLARI